MRWSIKPKPDTTKVKLLQKALNIDTAIAELLVQRGIETFDQAKHFFRPSLNNLHDPFLMKGMQQAVNRIETAIQNNESILIYGDYDVDGTTSVALMASYLKTKTKHITTYIPDRYAEGYGISYKGIDFASTHNITLIIALDCGIKAIDKVDYAAKKNIDFIICDHHNPGNTVPDAIAVLDPKQTDCNYPYKELCGCGVGFKLIQALATKHNQTINDLIPYLDLVATAIAADIVPITGENRILAYHGTKVINTNPRTGMRVMLEQTKKTSFTITDIVFTIAPRINAAGRMKHGNHAVNLLVETDETTAYAHAKDIEAYNQERKATDKTTTIEALQQIKDLNEQEKTTTVVYNENWHKGVIGIVASRLIETYYRPTLVFTKSGDKLAASARSVKGFNVYDAINACAEHIEQFGGHKYAAGLTLRPENYTAFKQKFEQVVNATIDKKLLSPEISIDSNITLTSITPKFHRILKQFAPFGPGNMTPIFIAEQLQDTGYAKPVGEDDKHLKLTATQHDGANFSGIGFNLGNKINLIKNKHYFSAAFSVEENEWNNKINLQLNLRDIK